MGWCTSLGKSTIHCTIKTSPFLQRDFSGIYIQVAIDPKMRQITTKNNLAAISWTPSWLGEERFLSACFCSGVKCFTWDKAKRCLDPPYTLQNPIQDKSLKLYLIQGQWLHMYIHGYPLCIKEDYDDQFCESCLWFFQTAGTKDSQTKTLAANDLSHLEQWGPSPRHPGNMIYGRPMKTKVGRHWSQAHILKQLCFIFDIQVRVCDEQTYFHMFLEAHRRNCHRSWWSLPGFAEFK